MRIRSRLAVLLMALVPLLPGYVLTLAGGVNSGPASSRQQAPLQEAASTSALQGSTRTTETAKANQAAPRDVVILRGSALGAVRFDHRIHSLAQNAKCETCHHPSRRERPAAARQQACTDCHTKVPVAPMRTKRQAAFHNATAATGTCIDCHKVENAHGRLAPVKCMACHKKENS
jgi:hypothetical protein